MSARIQLGTGVDAELLAVTPASIPERAEAWVNQEPFQIRGVDSAPAERWPWEAPASLRRSAFLPASARNRPGPSRGVRILAAPVTSRPPRADRRADRRQC